MAKLMQPAGAKVSIHGCMRMLNVACDCGILKVLGKLSHVFHNSPPLLTFGPATNGNFAIGCFLLFLHPFLLLRSVCPSGSILLSAPLPLTPGDRSGTRCIWSCGNHRHSCVLSCLGERQSI